MVLISNILSLQPTRGNEIQENMFKSFMSRYPKNTAETVMVDIDPLVNL
jgi:hypothetical protein